jgi:hypothetical protein
MPQPTEPFTTFIANLPAAGTVNLTDALYVQQPGNTPTQSTVGAIITAGAVLHSPVTYYVSSSGSDLNNGTSPVTPWQTIAKVNSVVPTPGSSFLFRAGDTFTGTIIVAASGIPNLPITYDVWSDANVGTTNTNPQGALTQATINSTVSQGLTCGDFDNLVIRNLNFTGSGPLTGGANGISINTTTSHSNYLIQNCTVSGYSSVGIDILCGDLSGATNPVVRNITIQNCLVFNCKNLGYQVNTHNINQGGSTNFLGLANVLFDHCIARNIIGGSSIFSGGAFDCQGVDGLTYQYCVAHDCGYSNSVNSAGPGIYCGNANNVLYQFNEVYNLIGGGGENAAFELDFQTTNCLVQYNYAHDCGASGIQMNTSVFSAIAQNDFNQTVRYNIVVNCGLGSFVGDFKLNAPGIKFNTAINGPGRITGALVYNNTVICNSQMPNNGQPCIGDAGGSGLVQAIVANNLFIASGSTQWVGYTQQMQFLNNGYVGGNAATPVRYSGANITLAAWLANPVNPEVLDGGVGGSINLAKTGDPLMLYGPPTATPTSLPGQPSSFQLSPMSPFSKNGLDLTQTLPIQTQVPYLNPTLQGSTTAGLQVDMDFAGQTYYVQPAAALVCSRASAAGTDLLFTDPVNRAFTTFPANTKRITTGRGLLIEGAKTQYLNNPTAPVTQATAAIPGGTSLILWVNGTGSAVLSNNGGTVTVVVGDGIATHGSPAYYQMGAGGTLTCTVTGTLYAFQLESDDGNLIPTSLIATQSTRDADVITVAAGQALANTLNSTFSHFGGGVLAVVNYPSRIRSGTGGSTRTIATDSNNNGYFAITDTSGSIPTDLATMNVGGSSITSSDYLTPNKVQVMCGRSDPAGMAVSVNGDFTSNGTAAAGNAGVNAQIGNRGAADQPLQGYLMRLMVWTFGAGNLATVDMPTLTSLTPIGVNVTRDFFGNPVPQNGLVSVGAHQPSTTGATVTLNGAVAVTVANTAVTANSTILFTLKTIGGAVGTYPAIQTITPGTGFTVLGAGGDTSTYNYVILG